MTGYDIEDVLGAILPEEALTQIIEESGLQERERKMEARLLLRSIVLAAPAGHGGRQADILAAYFQSGGKRVARCSFYAWFGASLERAMAAIRERALAFARAETPDLPGVLGRVVRDWHIVDSTTVKLPDEMMEEYPGAGDYAALKVHKRMSVGIGTTVDYHLSPAREHDSLHLKIDESWRGLGLLCDLGYASLARLRDCETHGVVYIIRLKDNWKPKVDWISRCKARETFVPGCDFDLAVESGDIELGHGIFDADVRIGPPGNEIGARMVGVWVERKKAYCFFLTNAPRALVAASTVADIYRVRWEIECDNKLDKSSLRLDELRAETGPAVRALTDASMVASILVCLLTHRHRLSTRPRRGATRTKPPIHPQTLGRKLVFACHRIEVAMSLTGKAARAEWDKLAEIFNYYTDPNWRRSPSVLDQMRGWKISRGRPRILSISAASAP